MALLCFDGRISSLQFGYLRAFHSLVGANYLAFTASCPLTTNQWNAKTIAEDQSARHPATCFPFEQTCHQSGLTFPVAVFTPRVPALHFARSTQQRSFTIYPHFRRNLRLLLRQIHCIPTPRQSYGLPSQHAIFTVATGNSKKCTIGWKVGGTCFHPAVQCPPANRCPAICKPSAYPRVVYHFAVQQSPTI